MGSGHLSGPRTFSAPVLPVVAAKRPVAKPWPERRATPSPDLTMTMLQKLSTSPIESGAGGLEARWFLRLRHRRSERFMLTAALYVAAALLIGSLVFINLENSVASSRQMVEQQQLDHVSKWEQLLQESESEAIRTATVALTQPTWTGLLGHIKDSRRLLPLVREYYTQRPYVPFAKPRFELLEISPDGSEVHLRLDAAMPWSNTVIMHRVGDQFKLDWENYRVGEKPHANTDDEWPVDPFLKNRIGQHARYSDRYFFQMDVPQVDPEE